MLRQRVITAILVIAVLALIVFILPEPAPLIAISVILVIGTWEWSQFLGVESLLLRLAYLLAIAVLMAVTWIISIDAKHLSLILEITLLWWFIALVWITRFPTNMYPAITALTGCLVLVPAWLSLSHLIVGPRGLSWVIFLLLLVWAADIGAYFAGTLWGRVKLAARVSPRKTWEGVIGGMILATLVAIAGAWFFSLDPVSFVALCVGVAAVSIVGDLTVSMFKRHWGIKDSGQLFPGHGGVLDRLDSLCSASPVFLLGLTWLGVA